MVPIAQTPTLAPDETLDDAVEWLSGREGLVLQRRCPGRCLIGPGDIERWYRREIEGRFDPDTRPSGSLRVPTDDPGGPAAARLSGAASSIAV